MQRHPLSIHWLRLVLAIGIGLAAAPVGAETYKWKDADGKVHYSDQPPPANAKEETTVKSRKQSAPVQSAPAAPTDKGAAKPKTYVEQEAAFKKRQVEEAEREAAEKKKAAEAAEKKQNCDQARAQLQTLQAGGRVTRTNTQGEREYLNDAQIGQEIDRAKKSADSWCK
jgi:Domain of unknown function (DUF4124)